MRDLDSLFDGLAKSKFRSSFTLRKRELVYFQQKGMDVILGHAREFVEQRLSPARPANDGRQTPMKNHPVFVAQHATATCCRKCLQKWHGIEKGRILTTEEIDYVLRVIERWLENNMVM